jgi:hypothetical protein
MFILYTFIYKVPLRAEMGSADLRDRIKSGMTGRSILLCYTFSSSRLFGVRLLLAAEGRTLVCATAGGSAVEGAFPRGGVGDGGSSPP